MNCPINRTFADGGAMRAAERARWVGVGGGGERRCKKRNAAKTAAFLGGPGVSPGESCWRQSLLRLSVLQDYGHDSSD